MLLSLHVHATRLFERSAESALQQQRDLRCQVVHWVGLHITMLSIARSTQFSKFGIYVLGRGVVVGMTSIAAFNARLAGVGVCIFL